MAIIGYVVKWMKHLITVLGKWSFQSIKAIGRNSCVGKMQIIHRIGTGLWMPSQFYVPKSLPFSRMKLEMLCECLVVKFKLFWLTRHSIYKLWQSISVSSWTTRDLTPLSYNYLPSLKALKTSSFAESFLGDTKQVLTM